MDGPSWDPNITAGAVFDPNITIGALEIGVLISYALFGFATLQAYIYFDRFTEDPRPLRCLVAFVWCCDLAHAICVGHTIYNFTISYYGQPEHLVRAPDSFTAGTIFSGLIAHCVQSFFSHRIYRLSNSWYIPCLCWGLSFIRLVFAMVASIEGIRMVTLVDYEQHWGWILTTIWALGAVIDLGIAGILVYLFYKQRSSLLPKRTATIVNKLILWTIETGILTSIAGIVVLACFVTMPDNYIWLAWYVVTTRLFTNALFASLNSRAVLRAMNDFRVELDLQGVATSSQSHAITVGVYLTLYKTTTAKINVRKFTRPTPLSRVSAV
ncbi:hypothetical protein C8R44DRAFT_135983 [Mycena epipterygia]|nr:hypothetical protein C8R44DRAFT_135983 [Mycena epipterygia]